MNNPIDQSESNNLCIRLYELGVNVQLYSVDQLLELLPACINTKRDEPYNYYWLRIEKRNVDHIRYMINYYCDTFSPPAFLQYKLLDHNIYDATLFNALAKMLIYLLENKFHNIKNKE